MVSLQGAQNAQPLLAQIDLLDQAIADLETYANPGTSGIWKMDLQIYQPAGTSNTVSIVYTINATDSTAILFDIRNVLGNALTILNNQLGAIT